MALGATMYVFNVDLADSDRGVYETLEIRAAQHPSETADYLWTRVIAYCLEYTDGIAFSKGLGDTDEPTVSVRDLTGALQLWVDIGTPDADRLHRASKAAPRVAVYCHKDAKLLASKLSAEKIHRSEALELYAIDRDWLAELVKKLARRMSFTLTVAERNLYLTLGEETFSCVVEQVPLGSEL
jgi:uncharacterized protein YaeQ